MLPNSNGKFCLLCNKTVVDFTEQTSYEIISHFQHNKVSTCGRFTKQQLNEYYTIYEVSKFNHYKFVASLALGLLTLDTLNAFSIDGKYFKNEKDSVQLVKLIVNNNLLDSASIRKIDDKKENQIILKGTIRDSTNNEPLIGVNIYLPNSTIGTVSDFDGNFELKVDNKFPIELKFSYVGYNSILKKITNSIDNINVKLSQFNKILQGEIITAGGIKIISKKEARKHKRKH